MAARSCVSVHAVSFARVSATAFDRPTGDSDAARSAARSGSVRVLFDDSGVEMERHVLRAHGAGSAEREEDRDNARKLAHWRQL